MSLDDLEKRIINLPKEERFATLVCCNTLVFGHDTESVVLSGDAGLKLRNLLEQDDRFVCEDFNMQTMITLQ